MGNAPPNRSVLAATRNAMDHKEAVMRQTMQKTPVRPGARRLREKAEHSAQERSEVREDVRRTWWPETDGEPMAGFRRR